MKKVILSISLLFVLVLVGCTDSSNGKSTNSDAQSKESTSDNKEEVKGALLDIQLDLTNTLRPYHSKITTYQTLASNEEEPPSEKDLQTAATEAKNAAKEAAQAVENFKINSEIPDDIKKDYSTALKSLQQYYVEVQRVLEESPLKADLSTAQEHMNQFQEIFNKIYEEVGLAPTDLSAELG
ncbi:hypothetical protein [Thalassobacillus pellis]|uniref:hypothetical protein n=1 Tax=Thalassobacillus pellis TaxID=748008 RepID=UPI00195F9D85|nr:hypothetical protein [Thalassobacillus pellis]MBM7554799.1 hypothetical protein [Thalassobacillus pellis]